MQKTEPTTAQIRALAAKADVDARTARKALTQGLDSIRKLSVRDRLREAMRETVS